jgi:hypothetical protein
LVFRLTKINQLIVIQEKSGNQSSSLQPITYKIPRLRLQQARLVPVLEADKEDNSVGQAEDLLILLEGQEVHGRAVVGDIRSLAVAPVNMHLPEIAALVDSVGCMYSTPARTDSEVLMERLVGASLWSADRHRVAATVVGSHSLGTQEELELGQVG